jgi:alginate O-acetyltransferase complex protein AlgI
MAFNSIAYIILLCLTVGVHYILPQRLKIFWLLMVSYYFYAQWNAYYLILIIASTLIDFFCAQKIENNPPQRRYWLGVSLCTNLGILFTFKYLGFFSQVAQQLAMAMGRPIYIPSLELLLPVGISFYTLQTLSYSCDVARGKLKAERSLWQFSTYVAFFPQLVAGPIERAQVLLPQFKTFAGPNWNNIISGSRRILWGIFKKTVIADRLASYVQYTYLENSNPNASALFCASILANVLIYADFSAYSDIAIGSARLMNIQLRENFNFPLFSTSMPDFWKRWHISLHSFFLDYVYYPLGGRKVCYWRWMLNIALVFLLSGLWHGAAWNFVIWSVYHLSCVLVHVHIAKLWAWLHWPTWSHPLWTPLKIILVHLQRGLSMILFFVPEADKGLLYLQRVFCGPWPTDIPSIFPFAMFINVLFLAGFLILMVIEGLHLKQAWSVRFSRMPLALNMMFNIMLCLSIMIFGVETNNPFIYFQF